MAPVTRSGAGLKRHFSDTNYLAVAGQKQSDLSRFNYEIFRVDRSGVEEQITALASNFSTAFIWRLKWSPNNRYIAFWLTIPGPDEYTGRIAQLHFLDTETKQVVDTCIRGLDNGISPIIWSPNSEQLAVQLGPEGTASAVIDLTTDQGIEFPADNLVGWMTMKPTLKKP